LSIRQHDRVASEHFLIAIVLVRCVTRDSLDRAHDFRPASVALRIVTVDIKARTDRFRHVTVKVCRVSVLVCSVSLLECRARSLVCSVNDKSCQSRVDVRSRRGDDRR
jgi:hypothetical protein